MALNRLVTATARTNMAELERADESERLQRYQRAWIAYEGEGPLPFGHDYGDDRDNVRLDYPALIVDKGVSYLAGKGGVTPQLEPPGDTDQDGIPNGEDDPLDANDAQAEERGQLVRRAEAALDGIWPEERRHLDFHQLAVNGGVSGHAWVRLHENGRVSILDPSNVTAVTNEDDVDIVERYLLEWNVTGEDGQDLVRRKRFEPNDPEAPTSWMIHTEELEEDTGRWLEDADSPTPWPHVYPPILGTQNLPAANTYYGRSDLEPAVLDLCEQIEGLASDMRRIVRLHGHPIPVLLGVDYNQVRTLDVAIGQLLAVPGDQAKLSQLAIAELTSSLALYKELKAALFEEVKIPAVALGEGDAARGITGVALQVEYEPLLEKTETKRLTYGMLWRQVHECVLDLLGFPGWKVTLGWPQLLPADEGTETAAAEADLRMGIVSRQTLAEKRGYDWVVERQRIQDEQAQLGITDPTKLLNQLMDGGGGRPSPGPDVPPPPDAPVAGADA